MKRYDNREKRRRTPKPVKNIELSDKNIRLRVILLIVAVALALLSFGYGISSCLSVESGWTVMEYNGSEINCSSEFIFMYDLGKGERSATSEYRNLTKLYTEITEKAYKLFCIDSTFADVNSVAAVNEHKNEPVKLDGALYGALKKFTEQGDRYIYMASVYSEYESLFFGYNGSVQAEQYDPYVSPETAAHFAKLAEYAGSSQHVTLDFLEDNQVRLNVSEEYLSYATASEIDVFVDFMWLRNAFIIDYLADTLIANGYTNGTLSSYDGFTRNLDTRGELVYDYNLFSYIDGTVYLSSKMQYSKPASIVYLRNYMIDELDVWHYYQRTDGVTVTPYIDRNDGFYKNSVGSMVSYAAGIGCADVALSMIPLYIADELDAEKLSQNADRGIYSVWFDGGILKYNEKNIKLHESYDDGTVKITAEYAGK